MNMGVNRICSITLGVFYGIWFAAIAQAYSFDMIVPDVRQPSALSGGSACPVHAHQLTVAGSIAGRWSTALNAKPGTILTLDQTASGRFTGIEQALTHALAVWASVGGATHVPATLT